MSLQLAEKFNNLLRINLDNIEEIEAEGDNAFEITRKEYGHIISKTAKIFLQGQDMVVIIFEDRSVILIAETGTGVYRTDSERYREVLLQTIKAGLQQMHNKNAEKFEDKSND